MRNSILMSFLYCVPNSINIIINHVVSDVQPSVLIHIKMMIVVRMSVHPFELLGVQPVGVVQLCICTVTSTQHTMIEPHWLGYSFAVDHPVTQHQRLCHFALLDTPVTIVKKI